jgi:hypothetical protein
VWKRPASGVSGCRTAYPELSAVTGPVLPDYRGEFLRGWDAGRGVDIGRSLGSKQEATAVSKEVYGARWVGIDNPDGAYTKGTVAYSSDDHEGPIARPYYKMRPRNVAVTYIVRAR